MSYTAAGWEPPLWLAALAAIALAAAAGRHVYLSRPAADRPDGWPVTLEVVLLGVTEDRTLTYRIETSHLPAGADPDAAALAVSGLDGSPSIPGAVSHSTSWRATADRRLILTHTALPDREAAGAVPLAAPSIVCSTDPLRPAPAGVHGHHIAAHGARHLAYLARTDPTVGRSAAQAPDIWALVSDAALAPVAPHDLAHAQLDRGSPRNPRQLRQACPREVEDEVNERPRRHRLWTSMAPRRRRSPYPPGRAHGASSSAGCTHRRCQRSAGSRVPLSRSARALALRTTSTIAALG